MRVVAQCAYVLHARPWRETSLIVELLTRDHGRIGVIARGVQGAKRHPLRAALQPLQSLRVDYVARGELARLVQAEALDTAPRLAGDRLMAAFYVHELLLKLTPRNDSAQPVFELYSRVRGELDSQAALGWTLRRFERDLLDCLGVGLPWGLTADGDPLDPDVRYLLDRNLSGAPAATPAWRLGRQPVVTGLGPDRRARALVSCGAPCAVMETHLSVNGGSPGDCSTSLRGFAPSADCPSLHWQNYLPAVSSASRT